MLNVSEFSFKILFPFVVKTADVKPNMSLNTYLREVMHLKGTKYMCKEGGCGSCVVGVTLPHPVTKKDVTLAINSVSKFSFKKPYNA